MPSYNLNLKDIEYLINGILLDQGLPSIKKIIDQAPEREKFTPNLNNEDYTRTRERYFYKLVKFEDYDFVIRHIESCGDSVIAADIQLKRPSRFSWTLINRNKKIITAILKILKKKYSEPIKVSDRDDTGFQTTQYHFKPDSERDMWKSDNTFEEWKTECSLYDERFSSGQTDPNSTDIRNDFIILRFKRKPHDELRLALIAAESNIAEAKYLAKIAFEYCRGNLINKNLELGLKYLKQASDLGDAAAQYHLAKRYYYGVGLPKSIELAKLYYTKSALQHNKFAQLGLGILIAREADNQNVEDREFFTLNNNKEAFEWIAKSANSGVQLAQSIIGVCYLNGDAVDKDIIQAHVWITAAANQDDNYSLNVLKEIESKMTLQQIKDAQKAAKMTNWYHLQEMCKLMS